ncbi:hypothetical protein QW71_17845 [Paenibacillus sp. IHB B 3415]|nr:hypothetical protein QW71_17845 [Paenibacillus sp. IHB B 3415]
MQTSANVIRTFGAETMFRIIAGVRNHPEGKSGSIPRTRLNPSSVPGGIKGIYPFLFLFPPTSGGIIGIYPFLFLFPPTSGGIKGILPFNFTLPPTFGGIRGIYAIYPGSNTSQI